MDDKDETIINIPAGPASTTTAVNYEKRLLTGKLPEPINPAEWQVSGGIGTAMDCYLNRSTDIDASNAHFVVCLASRSIKLVENENKKDIRKTYAGKLSPSAEIEALDINGDKRFALSDLRKLMKRHSYLFPSEDEYLSLMRALDNPKLVSEIASELSDDKRGSKVEAHSVKAKETNVPAGVNLAIPLFAGDDKTIATVYVDLCYMYDSHKSATFYLESFALVRRENEAAKSLLAEQVDRLKELDTKGINPAVVYA